MMTATPECVPARPRTGMVRLLAWGSLAWGSLAWVSLAWLGLALILGGCSATYPAYPIVPALLTERVPVPPPSDQTLSWRPGFYDFSEGNYIWRPGQWEPLAGHSTLWQDGYWVRSGLATYAWMPAGWK